MPDAEPDTSRHVALSGDTMRLIGLLIFLAGVVMIVLVFAWTYRLFGTIDSSFTQVSNTAPVTNPAVTAATTTPGPVPPELTVASPSPGPSVLDLLAAFGLRLVVLALMAWVGALVAARGADMARPHG